MTSEMNNRGLLLMLGYLAAVSPVLAMDGRILKRSDVVFMYQADQQTYADYGATVLAWGGKPTPKSRAAAQGVKFFGSVGMVTEFRRYYERFPETYEQGLCRDINGQPVKVPWLTDHQYQGIPYWWCCTAQPQFRQYLRERVLETVQAGADGVHIDDHMGSAGGLWLGLCFCDRCVDGFQDYLKSLPAEKLQALGVMQPDRFDYRQVVKKWISAGDGKPQRRATQHPLWPQWTIYQCRAAAAWMQQLRELAAKTAGHDVPFGANAGLLWPRHLSDFHTLDLFSAETDHRAAGRKLTDLPLVAYRMADAAQRPYAATASGGDWAFIKEHNLPGLVRSWIALSYAAGHCFMAPHHQWCHTPEKGTHWYAGPQEKFAPLYQFIRHHAELFDGYQSHADLAVVLPHRAFLKNSRKWFDICNDISTHGLSYRLLLAGDEIVDHPLCAQELDACKVLLIPDQQNLLPDDQKRVKERTAQGACYQAVSTALAKATPAVGVSAAGQVRALARVKSGSAVVHLLNYQYDAARDNVEVLNDVSVTLDLPELGLTNVTSCRWVTPEAEPVTLSMNDGKVQIPTLGLWGLLVCGD